MLGDKDGNALIKGLSEIQSIPNWNKQEKAIEKAVDDFLVNWRKDSIA